MTSKRIDDLTSFDWDDTALIKAYNDGMSLRCKELEEENSKDIKYSSKKSEWKAGDYCRAIYPEDKLVYEAKIVTVSGDTCTVDFLGYDDIIEVETAKLSKSKGKESRKKQIRKAKEYYGVVSAEESAASGDESRNNYSNFQSPRHHRRDSGRMNHFGDRTVAESTFHHNAMYPTPAHCHAVQPGMQTMPPPPPMLNGFETAQDPSLCAMMSSWYLAGYYTGLHQAQKGQFQQRCCCHTAQNCCHH